MKPGVKIRKSLINSTLATVAAFVTTVAISRYYRNLNFEESLQSAYVYCFVFWPIIFMIEILKSLKKRRQEDKQRITEADEKSWKP